MRKSNNAKAYSIGICIRYDTEAYTLAFIKFKTNLDVVLAQYQKLEDRKKFAPHVTYHGSQGIHHLVSYRIPWLEQKKQRLDTSFTGQQCLITQSFSRETARDLGHVCKGFDHCVTVDAIDIELKEERIQSPQREIRTLLHTASFQIDLIEPGRSDLIGSIVDGDLKIIKQKLIEDTFPWCLVTIMG